MVLMAIGDVCGQGGIDFLSNHLASLKRLYSVDVTVVNGENAAVVGATPAHIRSIYEMGADVVTLGNHVWARRELADKIDDMPYALRPLNMSDELPGNSVRIVETRAGVRVAVINLIGRVNMNVLSDNPFLAADRALNDLRHRADVFVVEIHAEATSEKCAMGFHLDGRVSVVFGTHTHIQTADERILPKGTGYITDLGMTGPLISALGVKPQQAVNYFLGKIHKRYESAPGPCGISGALFNIDSSGKCTSAERISIS